MKRKTGAHPNISFRIRLLFPPLTVVNFHNMISVTVMFLTLTPTFGRPLAIGTSHPIASPTMSALLIVLIIMLTLFIPAYILQTHNH